MKQDFAPRLAGRMLPGLFSCDLKIGQRERFPGDPRPHFPPTPQTYWMHADGCGAGLFRARPAHRQPWPADLDWMAMLPAPANQPRPAAMQRVLFPEATA